MTMRAPAEILFPQWVTLSERYRVIFRERRKDIDFRAARGLDKTLLRSLASASEWVERHENVFVCGPTGVGKSFLACALAQKACRDGFSALYMRAAALFRDLALARADGSLRNIFLRLSQIDVLVVDDWAMTPMSESERGTSGRSVRIVAGAVAGSYLPDAGREVARQIGDSTVAEGILDRIVHRAHRIELRGDSLRKNPPKETAR